MVEGEFRPEPSDRAGLLHLAGHFGLIVATALLIAFAGRSLWLLPALVLHGFVIVFLFAPLHESVHRTAFRSRRMNDAVAWICGLSMIVFNPALLSSGWLTVKLVFVLGLTAIHFLMNGWREDFARDANRRSQKFFRIANELPTLAMIVIVVMVIVRPF